MSTHLRNHAEDSPAVLPIAYAPSKPLVIATILREEGTTGVHTHFRELRRYLRSRGAEGVIVTPFSWGRPLPDSVFSLRLALEPLTGPPASPGTGTGMKPSFVLRCAAIFAKQATAPSTPSARYRLGRRYRYGEGPASGW